VAIPEFQAIATAVGQQYATELAGSTSVEDALANAQALTTRGLSGAGDPYKKIVS